MPHHPEAQGGEGARLDRYFAALTRVAPSLERLRREALSDDGRSTAERQTRVTARFQRRMRRALRA